jgi:hypothetical protein
VKSKCRASIQLKGKLFGNWEAVAGDGDCGFAVGVLDAMRRPRTPLMMMDVPARKTCEPVRRLLCCPN